jgi:hypothetical protein
VLSRRFPISFGRLYALLSRAVLLPPRTAYVEMEADEVHVRMGWAFRARFPRSAVASVVPFEGNPLSRGVHGYGGCWLVNGSGRGLLRIDLDPPPRAYAVGFPIRLRQLLVSVEDPPGLVAALAPRR